MIDDVSVELARVVDRLRSMPLARLSRPSGEHSSLAEGARALAQRLADQAVNIGGWPRHEVPDVGDAAVGDQVAVTGRDLLGLSPGDDVLAGAAADLRAFRLSM
ncbi:MAG: hypothetical protein ACO3ID_01485 [Candidatus Nanopelagicales bacterium]